MPVKKKISKKKIIKKKKFKKKIVKKKVKVKCLNRGRTDTGRRLEWEINHDLIEKAYWKLTLEDQKAPSAIRIAKLTGLSVQGVQNHYKELSFDKVRQKHRSATSEIMKAVALRAKVTGDPAAAKLHYQTIEDWKEGQKIEHDHNIKQTYTFGGEEFVF